MASSDYAQTLRSFEIFSPKSGPTTTILTSAITSSLTHLGYDAYLIQHVSLLSTSNTHTVSCSVPQTLLHHPSRTYGVQHALATLFKDVKANSAGVHSNESVLLINNLDSIHAEKLHELTDAAVRTLREVYHVRPIRIYAGNFTPATGISRTEQHSVGFSVSLLIVVNTDIGGPSMVQLLDMADWRGKGALRMENWDGSGWNLGKREDFDGEIDYGEFKEADESEDGASGVGEWEGERDDKGESQMVVEDVMMQVGETTEDAKKSERP